MMKYGSDKLLLVPPPILNPPDGYEEATAFYTAERTGIAVRWSKNFLIDATQSQGTKNLLGNYYILFIN